MFGKYCVSFANYKRNRYLETRDVVC